MQEQEIKKRHYVMAIGLFVLIAISEGLVTLAMGV